LTPRFAKAFADALLAKPAQKVTIPGVDPPLVGTPGIGHERSIQYRDRGFQKLHRGHEYTFKCEGLDPLEVSLQFYENLRDHWRLFAYCRAGMLFSLNLTTAQEDGSARIPLRQRLKSASRHMNAEERDTSMAALAEHLRWIGLRVSPERDLDLGEFDVQRRRFVRTTARGLIRDFLTVAVLKGHFMGNKRYTLPGLVPVSRLRPNALAQLLENEQLIAEDEHAFDPADDHDARKRTLAAIVRRQGQHRFRAELLKAYGGRCAISGCDAVVALEAAHIQSYRGEHTNDVRNGLLLRADLHTLFDLRHITVNSADMTLRISDALRGTTYEELEGRRLSLPEDARRPSKKALDLHRKNKGR